MKTKLLNYFIKFLSRKPKPLQTVYDEKRIKPTLKINNSVIPQEYLNSTKHWDTHLYKNQKIC